jgi:protein-tyrosine phosphatase
MGTLRRLMRAAQEFSASMIRIVNEIFWIAGRHEPHLAIVARPQGGELLESEMEVLRAGGIDTLVSMLEPHEAEWLGLAHEADAADHAGIKFVSHPIPDGNVPQVEPSFRTFATDLARRLAAGEHVGIHCRGCIGRATIAATCALIHLGWDAQSALTAVAHARGVPVPDTPEQESWILAYEAHP